MAYDVIVIGAGLAGLTGGLRLAEAGRRVLLLAKGHSHTHWSAGTIGVANDEQPLAAVARLAAQLDHPYARAGVPDLTAAVARLRELCAAANYPLAGALDRNTRLPTAVGALRPAALFPGTMAAGDAASNAPILVAGFREFRDFFPSLVAANLTAQGLPARGVSLDLPRTRRQLDFPTTSFGRLFEDRAFRADVGRQLRAARGDAARIALPAVLGLRDAGAVVNELRELSGVPVFEIPTPPPSVPGIRLYDILAEAFQRAGGRLQIGSWVLRGEGEGRRLRAIYTEAAAREQRHTADYYLLATGGIAGGGLRTDHTGAIVETALGLPVAAPAQRTDWFAPRFLAPEGHAIYRAGIGASATLRPLDSQGVVVYENVVVACAALAGADLIHEGAYEGVALATGWRAAGELLGAAGETQNAEAAGLPAADH